MSRPMHPPRKMNSPAARAMTYDHMGYVVPSPKTQPLTAFIVDGTSRVVVSARAVSLFLLCGSPLSPMDLCDGPVRS